MKDVISFRDIIVIYCELLDMLSLFFMIFLACHHYCYGLLNILASFIMVIRTCYHHLLLSVEHVVIIYFAYVIMSFVADV